MGLLMKRRFFSSFRIIVFGFLVTIFIGALLLMLPIATQSGKSASFSDAFFTSTSAVCVTGLVVQDTATYWSMFGQIVILVLIQTGGIGVITVAIAAAMLSGRKIGLFQRSMMREAISAPNMAGIVRLTGFILKVTFGTELIGAVIMAPVFCREFGIGQGCWYSLFHSISAFCNAGFDLMGIRGQFSSFTSFAGQPIINFTIMFLIIFGGIGFLTWRDIWTNKLHVRKYRMQTKVILTVTALLIVLPSIYYYFFDFSGCSSQPERMYMSVFQSVTTRTAGFNTADLTSLTGPGAAIMILLMLVGGSPGSTAGGMKTTTIAVLFACVCSVFRQKDDAHFFGRRIAIDTVKSAITLFFMYVTMSLTGAVVISIVEKLPLGSCIFETASAIGTVGLTLGITPGLGAVSRIILISLMFFGRIGGITLIFAALSKRQPIHSRYPQEKITVG